MEVVFYSFRVFDLTICGPRCRVILDGLNLDILILRLFVHYDTSFRPQFSIACGSAVESAFAISLQQPSSH